MQARMYLCLITINSQIHVYRANFHLAIAKVLVLLELFVSFVPSLLTWLITHACWIPHIWLNELFIELSIFHLGAAYEKYRGPLGNVRKGVLVSILVTLQRLFEIFSSVPLSCLMLLCVSSLWSINGGVCPSVLPGMSFSFPILYILSLFSQFSLYNIVTM